LNREKINLIGYACGHGAQKGGCKDAAVSLKINGLSDDLNKLGLKTKWNEIYYSALENSFIAKGKDGREQRLSALPIIIDYCNNLYATVEKTIKNGEFPITIGGDHSMAIGTWGGVTRALNAQGSFGLIWFDAHMDSHTITTSHSGAYHGTPLSYLMGQGEDDLKLVGGAEGKLNPKHVCLVGIRSYEPEEMALLKKLGVRIFFMEEIKQKGLKKVVQEAAQIVAEGTAGYGISLDLDFFDPEVAPGTGTLEADGVKLDEALAAFKYFSTDERLKAIEIAEYNPHLDGDGVTAKVVVEVLRVLLVG
jgi:arginase